MKNHMLRLAIVALISAFCCSGIANAQRITAPAPGSGTQHDVGPVQGTTSTPAVDIVSGTPGFSTFAQIVTATGIIDTLRGSGPYTIFAPSDEAFARMPSGELQNLLRPENRDRLRAIVQYWVVPQAITVTGTIHGPTTYQTMEGDNVTVNKTASGAYTVNGANIVERDVQASNGMAQIVDSVLIPNRRTPTDTPKNPTH